MRENNKRPTIFDCHVMYILQNIGGRGIFRTHILFKTTDIQHNFSEEAIQSAIEQVTYELDKVRTELTN